MHFKKITISFLLASTMLISACGGDSPGSKVEYSDKVAQGTVADYANANWLYQNYFGDYGLPEELKPSFLPALQMLANGFVMQLKTGQDVKKNIEQVNSMFLSYASSGEAAKFFAQVQTDIQNSDIKVTKKTDFYQNTKFVEPVISEEDKISIDLAKKRDLADDLEIQKLAEQYQLPYKIAEQKEQWFIYSPTMKGVGKGGGTKGTGGTNGSESPSAPKSHKNINRWGWRPGDVVYVNGEGSIDGVPGHVAIVGFLSNGSLDLVDANRGVGVSRSDNVQKWMDRYTEVRALSPRLNWSEPEFDCYNQGWGGCKPDSYIRQRAFWYALYEIGKPYNWIFTNPRDTSKYYCTSLIWNVYNAYGYNIIKPWTLGPYGIITPSEIRDSSALETFKVSVL